MGRIFLKYENLILLVCLLLFAAVLLSNNAARKKETNFLEKAVLTVTTPLQTAVTSTVRHALATYLHYFQLVDTAKQNDTLRALLHEEMFKNNALREELKKYRRLDQMISHRPAMADKWLTGNVVSWDATNIARTMVVDLGAADGVKEGMVALTHKGLVGRVVAVSANASRVLLITDARSAVDAYVQRSRARCIIAGQNRKRCDVIYLSVNADVKAGDMLVSSGLGGVFPPGINLGHITTLEAGSSKLFFRAEMLPAGDLERLEEVIITSPPPALAEELPAEGRR